jgi:Protein of unknown function (DUF3788)
MPVPANMPANAFIGQDSAPTDADLTDALGPVKPVWDQIIATLSAEHGVTISEWSCYSRKQGWSLRLKRGKRTIVWLAPCDGCMRVAFVLGDKAIAAARQSHLSSRVLRFIDQGERYPEGTGIRLHLTGAQDLPVVMQLAAIKIAS